MAIYDGAVDWSGENPGLYLKTDPSGPFTSLASFFRVVVSPHGPGHACVVVGNPDADAASPDNFCLTDNEPLARYVVSDFLAHFGQFKGLSAVSHLTFHGLDRVETGGAAGKSYTETVHGSGRMVRLVWDDLAEPFALEMPADKSATGKHIMLSVFRPAAKASLNVDGRALPGVPVKRDMLGREITTAFLAYSETWIKA